MGYDGPMSLYWWLEALAVAALAAVPLWLAFVLGTYWERIRAKIAEVVADDLREPLE